MAVAINFKGPRYTELIGIIVSYKKGDFNLQEASHLLCNKTGLTTNAAIGLLFNMTRRNVISLPIKVYLDVWSR